MNISAKLLIFDWDGTLIDSQAKIIHCLQEACRREKKRVPDHQSIRSIIGLSFGEAFKVILPDLDMDEHEAIRRQYRELFFNIDRTPMQLFSGVESMLAELHGNGLLLAVATGKSRTGLDRVLEETELTHLFHSTRCADETESKPHPLMLHQILEELDVAVENAIMIGDSSYDLEMARNAGMKSVGVSSGSHDPDHLGKFGPVAILDVVTDILKNISGSDHSK